MEQTASGSALRARLVGADDPSFEVIVRCLGRDYGEDVGRMRCELASGARLLCCAWQEETIAGFAVFVDCKQQMLARMQPQEGIDLQVLSHPRLQLWSHSHFHYSGGEFTPARVLPAVAGALAEALPGRALRWGIVLPLEVNPLLEPAIVNLEELGFRRRPQDFVDLELPLASLPAALYQAELRPPAGVRYLFLDQALAEERLTSGPLWDGMAACYNWSQVYARSTTSDELRRRVEGGEFDPRLSAVALADEPGASAVAGGNDQAGGSAGTADGAAAGRRILGISLARWLAGARIELSLIAILPDEQRRGISRQAAPWYLRRCRQLGVASIVYQVSSLNHKALGLARLFPSLRLRRTTTLWKLG